VPTTIGTIIQEYRRVLTVLKNEKASGGFMPLMADDEPTDKTGNEPAPLLLAAVAIVPLLAVAGWFVFG